MSSCGRSADFSNESGPRPARGEAARDGRETRSYGVEIFQTGLARDGKFDELSKHVTEPMLDAFVTRARTFAEFGRRLRERYNGMLDRVGLYGDATKIDRESLAALTVGLRD